MQLPFRAKSCYQRFDVRIAVPVCLALAVAAMSVATATATPTTPDDLSSLREALREHLRDPKWSPEGRAAFVVTEQAVIDDVLHRALRYLDLSPPMSAATRHKAAQNAVTYYRLALGEGAGLRALEARVAQRFAHPLTQLDMTTQPGRVRVTADLGWLPGPLSHRAGEGYHVARTAASFDGAAPATALLARHFQALHRQYPDASSIELRFGHPYYGRVARYRMIYTRSRESTAAAAVGWVRTEAARAVGLVPPFAAPVFADDWAPYVTGGYSLFERCDWQARTPGPSHDGRALHSPRPARCLTAASPKAADR
ncbi:MAG: hypothetical protein JNL19_05645 [Burkholderiales bacterium]|nr:hypothetical protein [Burkholderiales bacterium]